MSDFISDLDRIIDRIVRNDPVLVLERESALWWTVTDTANGGEVMMRADRELCVRFMRAFLVKHPEATTDPDAMPVVMLRDVEYSWRVAQDSNVLPLRSVS